jgi:hypothetical protein
MEVNEVNENSDSDNEDAAPKPSVNESSSIQHDGKLNYLHQPMVNRNGNAFGARRHFIVAQQKQSRKIKRTFKAWIEDWEEEAIRKTIQLRRTSCYESSVG